MLDCLQHERFTEQAADASHVFSTHDHHICCDDMLVAEVHALNMKFRTCLALGSLVVRASLAPDFSRRPRSCGIDSEMEAGSPWFGGLKSNLEPQ